MKLTADSVDATESNPIAPYQSLPFLGPSRNYEIKPVLQGDTYEDEYDQNVKTSMCYHVSIGLES